MGRTAFSLAVVLVFASLACAEERGTLRGRFVYDGKPPELMLVNGVKNESLLVNEKDAGLKNVIVALNVKAGDKPPLHPDVDKLQAKRLTMSWEKTLPKPRVMPMLTGQEVQFHNIGPRALYLKCTPWKNTAFGLQLKIDEKAVTVFKEVESIPVRVTSQPGINSLLMILDHPFVAVTDAHGKFEIANIPEGEWTFLVWHEGIGLIPEVSLDGKKTKWERGRFSIKMNKDGFDLGDVRVSPKLFQD